MKPPISKEVRVRILPAICVVTFTVLLVAAMIYFKNIWGFISTVVSLAKPFFIGFAIAFLLGPIQRKMEKKILRPLLFKKGRFLKLMRAISSLLSLVFLLAIIALFMFFMVPQLIDSIRQLVTLISNFIDSNSLRINQMLMEFEFASFDGEELVVAWNNIASSLISNIEPIVGGVFNLSKSIVNVIYQLLVGLITAFYIMMDKEKICAQIKKIGYGIFKRDRIEALIYWTRRANHIFSSFIVGKIIDSAIMGVLCYIGMLIFKMEYPLLISCVIGVTNIIPFFGPFIGWIPCTLILLIINPMSAVWFSLFILVLQQLDGNVIGPHILGDYVGVSALSIMIAIVIGGGLFGFTGMLVSVPVYALGYAIFRTMLHNKLKKNNLPTDTAEYINAPEGLPKAAKAEEPEAEAQA
ncbi:MAG: AI-2E family transporter [Clostridia bacterium]|nr:AI-2E family transporter [Clostridia bacterium]